MLLWKFALSGSWPSCRRKSRNRRRHHRFPKRVRFREEHGEPPHLSERCGRNSSDFGKCFSTGNGSPPPHVHPESHTFFRRRLAHRTNAILVLVEYLVWPPPL